MFYYNLLTNEEKINYHYDEIADLASHRNEQEDIKLENKIDLVYVKLRNLQAIEANRIREILDSQMKYSINEVKKIISEIVQ